MLVDLFFTRPMLGDTDDEAVESGTFRFTLPRVKDETGAVVYARRIVEVVIGDDGVVWLPNIRPTDDAGLNPVEAPIKVEEYTSSATRGAPIAAYYVAPRVADMVPGEGAENGRVNGDLLVPVPGASGQVNVAGPSAYQIAVANGFVGTEAEWLASLKNVTATLSALPSPCYIAHRGGADVWPENTMEAFRGCIAAGAHGIETDVVLLSDGSLGIMHDATVDRTTTATGNTGDLSAASWQLLRSDAGTWFAPAWPNDLRVPTFSDLLREFGNKTILVLEPKTQATLVPMLAMLDEHGIEKDTVIIEVANAGWLGPALDEGWHTMVVDQNGAETPATIAATGAEYVVINGGALEPSRAADLLAEGLKVWAFNLKHHYWRDSFAEAGVIGFVSDDPIYMLRGGGRTTDQFAEQTWFHGQIGEGTFRGEWIAPDKWGYTWAPPGNWRGRLAGEFCPVDDDPEADTYTVTATATFDSATAADRFVSLVVACPDDRRFTNSVAPRVGDGYHCLLRKNGVLAIYRIVGGSGTLLIEQSGTAISDGGTATVEVDVSPTSITFRRTDGTPYSCTTSDTTHRGGYFHIGMQGIVGSFKDVSVTT